MRKLILATLLATSGMTVAAKPVFAETEVAQADAKADKELKDLEKLFSTMFDNKDLGPIDPQRLTLAKQATSQIMPDGIYSKMMSGLMDKVMGAFLMTTGGMSDMEISLATGVDVPESGFDAAKRQAVTDLLDPNHAQRTATMKNMINPVMDKMARVIEPPMREGLARAYARKFSFEQLTELNGFFATPTGSVYASESFLLQADPEVMQSVFSAMPSLLGELGDPSADMEKTMAAIPAAKTLGELSAKEKDSLAKLLGTTADKLSAFGAVETSSDAYGEAADAANDAANDAASDAMAEDANADPFSNESGTEPWWDRSNWDAADQTKIAELEARADTLGEQSSAASAAYVDFETEVMLRLRERYFAKGWKPSESSE